MRNSPRFPASCSTLLPFIFLILAPPYETLKPKSLNPKTVTLNPAPLLLRGVLGKLLSSPPSL